MKTTVRTHSRKLRSGKTINIKRHDRRTSNKPKILINAENYARMRNKENQRKKEVLKKLKGVFRHNRIGTGYQFKGGYVTAEENNLIKNNFERSKFDGMYYFKK